MWAPHIRETVLGAQRSRLGPERVVAALVSAARALFAERGPDAVSIRDVARRAGVNHGLVHHYIGSRDDLLRMVFEASAQEALQAVKNANSPLAALTELRAMGQVSDDYVRLLAWTLLSRQDVPALQEPSTALKAIVGAAGDDSREVRVALAVAVVQLLGWELFGPFVAAGLGLDENLPTLRADADALVDSLLTAASARVR